MKQVYKTITSQIRDGYIRSRKGITAPYSDEIDLLFSQRDQPGTAGLIIAVLRNGKVVHQRGYGVANIEDDIPFTPNTVLRLGSTSKHMTATCILILENREKLSLDDDIRKFIPELPDYGISVTIRHLLTMTSGFPDGLSMGVVSGLSVGARLSREQIVRIQQRQKNLMFKPGDDCIYSNTNYTLLSQIIERISGNGLDNFMKDEIFRPLEMNSTQLTPNMAEVISKKARGYQPSGYWEAKADNKEIPETGYFFIELSGDGGIDSTINDMIKWYLNYRNDRLFGPNYRQRMETETVLNDGSIIPYGLGLTISKYRGLKKVSHAGGMPGYLCDFVHYPEQDFGIIMLSNWIDQIILDGADKITDIMLRKEIEKTGIKIPTNSDPEDPVLITLTGLYVNIKKGYSIQFTQENNEYICYMMGDRIRLVKMKENVYVSAKRTVSFNLTVLAKKRKKRPLLNVKFGAQNPLRFVPCESEAKETFEAADYLGTYSSQELGETHIVAIVDEDLVVELSSPFRSLLWRILSYRIDDIFTADIEGEPSASNVTMKFNRDSTNRVTSFEYSTNRIRNVLFEKQNPTVY